MTKNIKQLFFLIKGNEVLACESNLRDLISGFPEAIQGIRSYDYYHRQFAKSNYFQFEFNREYFFQKKEYN